MHIAGQFRVDLPAAAEPAELLVRPGHGRVPVRVVADRDLPYARLASSAVPRERLQQTAVRFDRDHQVRQATGQLAGLFPGYGDPDRRRLLGHVPQSGRVDLEVLAVAGDVLSKPLCCGLTSQAVHDWLPRHVSRALPDRSPLHPQV